MLGSASQMAVKKSWLCAEFVERTTEKKDPELAGLAQNCISASVDDLQ